MTAALAPTYEVPKPRGFSTNAGGTFTATYDTVTRQLKWSLTFHNLTGPATAAHIHTGAFRRAGPVLVPLCGPCVSGASGTVTLKRAQVNPRRPWYVNVHTSRNPSGEIRGQVLGPVLPLTGGPGGGTTTSTTGGHVSGTHLRCCPSG
ncbi:MAG TPA: CHRD domain-containing protein [Gaiellaceae bacterium]|nr:CHRD domain-containing protein [Gaiellaceae bacterium]